MIVARYSDIYIEDSSLRPYQIKAKKDIYTAWDKTDNVMFQMPTGTGKTRLLTSIIKDITEYGKKKKEAINILIIAHRNELIEQISESLDKYNVPHNTIVKGWDKKCKFPVSVASLLTLTHPYNLNAAEKLNIQFIFIDEAHHALANNYQKLWDLYPNSKKLGVTATPCRMNHKGFLDLFETLVTSMPIKEFIRQCYLSPYKYYSLRSNSIVQKTIDGLELDSFGEYKESSMSEKMDVGKIRAQLLKSYKRLANGKKGIIYAINIAHAKHICDEYSTAGYNTVCIDSNTKSTERKDLINKFKNGKIDIIVNVDIFSEGFDCPDIEFIQLARPTRSLVKYLQQVGRGLRPTEGKEHCIILDNVGMYSRFRLPDARRHWNKHFMGQEVDEELTKVMVMGNGGSRGVNMSEGTEDMVLIQDSNEDYGDVADATGKNKNKKSVDFDPISSLVANHFCLENFTFYFLKNKKIYESYIHDDKYVIVSELIIDNENHSVHRIRVGKIQSDSWMYWQMLREKIDEIMPIEHYGGNYTLFHYRVISTDNTPEDKYFDYRGKEIDKPETVKESYHQAILEGKVRDYIDAPVSKAFFKLVLENNRFTLFKTIKGMTRLIGTFPVVSEFGQYYLQELDTFNNQRESFGLPKILAHNTDWIEIIRGDEKSFNVMTSGTDKNTLLEFNLQGKLLQTDTIGYRPLNIGRSVSSDDYHKWSHAFDNKGNSYKYFWFISLLQIYNETQVKTIPFSKIMVRMVANAWKYVFLMDGKFSSTDDIPWLLNNVMSETKLNKKATEKDVEEAINNLPKSSYVMSRMRSLLDNVPYRFLSPWVPFTSKGNVAEDSRHSETRCPYELYDDYIIISELWKRYLIDSYEDLLYLTRSWLKTYLRARQITMYYSTLASKKFNSLSRLLKEVQKKELIEVAKPFFLQFRLPLTGKITPADIINRIPESNWIIDTDGQRKLNVSYGEWSLKILEELLS